MHVLTIEEVDIIAAVIRDAMGHLGYASCDIAEDEDQAVQLASVRCPDLICAESRLHDGTGVAAIRRIFENRIIPVIFVTADPESVFAAYAEAVVVEKPFISADLKAAVATAVASCERSTILHQPSGKQL